MGDLSRDEYLAQARPLRDQMETPTSITPEIDLDAAERYLDDIALVWRIASPAQRKRLQQALFSKVWVRGRQYEEVTPARPEYLAYFAAALSGAPPDGLEPPTRTLGRCRSIH